MKISATESNSGQPENPFIRRRVLAILLLAWLSLFAGINSIPLGDHEAFVLQTAREMGMNNDWVLPYFSGEPRLTKPPLSYWLTLGISLTDPFATDIEPWHARAWPMVGGLLLVFFTAYIGNRLYGGRAGLLAAALLLGTKGFTEFSLNARPDFLYSALCVLQLFAWIAAWRAEDDSRAQRLNAGLGWMLAALATLSKGPQAPAVFLLGFLLFLLCGADRGRALKVLRPFSGVVVWVALCVPWWLLLQERIKMLGVDLGETQLSGSLLKSLSDWKELLSFYYVSRLLLLMLPTSLLLPLILYLNRKRLGRPDDSDRLLLFAGATMLAVFSVAGHYRTHYMLPLMPLAALLLAASADRVTVDRMPERAWRFIWGLGASTLVIYPVLLIGKQLHATGLLLAGTSAILIVLLRAELREPVWRNHPFTATLLACSLLVTPLFAGFNAYSERGNLSRVRDFSLSVGKMLHDGDVLLASGSYPYVIPYYARHRVESAGGLDELKKRVAKKGAGQDFYLLARQDEIAALNEIFETSTPLTVVMQKSPRKMLNLTKILGVRGD